MSKDRFTVEWKTIDERALYQPLKALMFNTTKELGVGMREFVNMLNNNTVTKKHLEKFRKNVFGRHERGNGIYHITSDSNNSQYGSVTDNQYLILRDNPPPDESQFKPKKLKSKKKSKSKKSKSKK